MSEDLSSDESNARKSIRQVASHMGSTDDSDEYAGPGPGEWRDVNPTPEELFSTDE